MSGVSNKKKRCHVCGALLEEDAKFCDYCGNEVKGGQSSQRRVLIVLAVVCCVVLLTCILIIFMFQDSFQKKEKNQKREVTAREDTDRRYKEETDNIFYRRETESEETGDTEPEQETDADIDAVHNRECMVSGVVYFTDSMDAPVIALDTPLSIYVNSTSGDRILFEDVEKLTFGSYSYSDQAMKRHNNTEVKVSGSLWAENDEVFIDVKEILGEIKEEESETETEETQIEEDEDSYILPESNSRFLTESDVSGLSLQEINYAKNEIYARHGRKFDSKELRTYFNSKSWYHPTIDPEDFTTKVFNSYEKKNSEFLAVKEESMRKGGYRLDQ